MATTNGVKGDKIAMDEPPPKFALPVDSEYKAKAMNLFSLSRPHMLSFHLNWVAFFITFLAAFASAPLVPIIRDSINLEQYQANIAGSLIPLYCSVLVGTFAQTLHPAFRAFCSAALMDNKDPSFVFVFQHIFIEGLTSSGSVVTKTRCPIAGSGARSKLFFDGVHPLFHQSTS